MSPMQLCVVISLVSAAFAASVAKKIPPLCDPNTGIGCLPSPDDCPQGCVCNRTDVRTVESTTVQDIPEAAPTAKLLRTEFKFVRTVTNYGSAGVSAMLHEKVESVFRGIMLSAALFITCAGICVLSVCLYCCHIRKSDRKLKLEIDALAKKLKVDVKPTPGPSKPAPDCKGDSCNVVVQDANVMCV